MANDDRRDLPPPWQGLTPSFWDDLAGRYGTPFYLFDADAVARRVRQVKAAFNGLVEVYFAVKANPNLGLMQALRASVDGLDISSGGELSQALRAGYAPAAMSFAGPAKTDDELSAAIAAGVGAISVESMREIDACARLAERLGRPANILLRVNPQLPARAYGLKMGGRAVQFGVDEEALPDAQRAVAERATWLVLQGLHAYVGSQCFDAAGSAEATRNALRLAAELQQRSGTPLREVNLGGGFGLASGEDRKELDLTALAQMLEPDLRAFKEAHPGCRVFFELGRYLLADAGVYVTRVVSSKTSRGKRFAACDGGLNHQLAAAGTFGAALRGNFPLRNLSRPEATPVALQVAGPSCNPTDLLGVDATLPEPEPGDLLGVLMSGAYGLTASPVLFLGRSTPAELVRSGGSISVGRRRHDMADFN